MSDDDAGRWLNDREQRAWRGYRRMHLLLDARIAQDLAADSGLSDADYDVLTRLSEEDGNRIRVTDLAARMLWSQSRLSHHLARMRQRGLVTREGDAADGRVAMIALTDEGRRVIEAAAPDHVASVRRHLFDALSPEQVDALAAIADAVVGRLRDSR
ncbi:MarR family winged helix-turn-helix transcriptional regulator [Streptomyces sp. NPDC018031]|uniref:MarR family winged helix-turn-helix transcriptional regulator n=1 Tax=Streptomyces sp. NPDC018031 TaxID=3365033 RepID=UPI0037B36585